MDVAIDSKDNLYVADTYNNRIQKIQPDGNITSIGKSMVPAIGEFYIPYRFGIDSKDNLYVADRNNQRVQKFALSHLLKIDTYGKLNLKLKMRLNSHNIDAQFLLRNWIKKIQKTRETAYSHTIK